MLIGEFSETITIDCSECNCSPGCEICGGDGKMSIDMQVSWGTIKEIYKKAVEYFSERE